MASKPVIDQAVYLKLCDAFKRLGPAFSQVCKLTGFSVGTLSKAWNSGWPDRGFKPIKEHAANDYADLDRYLNTSTIEVVNIREDQDLGAPSVPLPRAVETPPAEAVRQNVTARHETLRQENEALSQPPAPPKPATAAVVESPAAPVAALAPTPTVEDAILKLAASRAKTLTDEQELTASSRNALKGLVVSLTGILAGYQPVIKNLKKRLEEDARDDVLGNKGQGVSVTKTLDEISHIVQRVVTSGKTLMEMERLLMGMPQTISEQRTNALPSTDEDRAKRLALLATHVRGGQVIDVDPVPYAGEEIESPSEGAAS